MKNSDLMKITDTVTLTQLERQARYVLRFLTSQMPCPNCGHQQSFLEAHGIALDDYDVSKGSPGDDALCIMCRRHIRYTVPFFSGPMCWSLVPDESLRR